MCSRLRTASNPRESRRSECGRLLRGAGIALAVAALVAACASTVDKLAEDTIRRELPRLVGPALDYRVEVRGVVPASGGLQRVTVTGRRIARPGAPVIDDAEIDLRDVRIDQTARRVSSIGAVDARVRVLAADIAAHLDARAGLDAVSVRFEGQDEIDIGAAPKVAGVSLPTALRVQLHGRLVADGPRLMLRVTGLRAAGSSLGALPRFALEQLVNPLVDLSRLPAPAELRSVRVDGDALLLEAGGVAAELRSSLQP